MTEFSTRVLLSTHTVSVRDIVCGGGCRHRSAEECSAATHLVFPYRGVYVRHVNREEAVAEANQVLFFNSAESYRISHPVTGGDACLSLAIGEGLLQELTPKEQLRKGGGAPVFRRQHKRIDSRTQMLVAKLRHSLNRDDGESLEVESLALTLSRCALDVDTSDAGSSAVKRKLVDRAKLVLSADLSRRWTLSDIAQEVGVSPVYLTQVFQQVEGMPLYRYQLRLRLTKALDVLGRCEDLTQLSLDLGFSSHSHFTAAFRQTYGCTPAQFRRSLQS